MIFDLPAYLFLAVGLGAVGASFSMEQKMVGIGTATPSHQLSVDGSIRANEIIVDFGWTDYVFADDFRLAPLDEVSENIKWHKRLSGIPSAAKISEEVLRMGEMQALMMAKIEDLTLHVIELEKRTRTLESENAILKTRE